MTEDQREIRRKKRVLEYAEKLGNINTTCRRFGIARSTFYLWRDRYRELGEAGLARRRRCSHNYPNKTPDEVVEKILHLRRTYYMGPIRIVWYLQRYHDIKINYVVKKFPFRIRTIRTDRGHEFQALFHWHVADQGMEHVYIKPRTPQLNGKVERSHRTDKDEFYQLLTYRDDVDLKKKLAAWEKFYNYDRPHGAHKGKTPYEALREKLS